MENNGKGPLKRFLEKYLDPELIYRKKSGFSIPLQALLNTSLEIKQDKQKAFAYLDSINALPKSVHAKQLEPLTRTHPYLVYSALMLYHALLNQAKWASENNYE